MSISRAARRVAIASRSCVATTAIRIAASLRELVQFVASFSCCSSFLGLGAEDAAAEDEAHKFFFADIEEKPPKPRFRVLCRTEELTELITTGLMETADRIAAGLDIDPRVSVEKLEKQRAAKAAAERAKLLAS